MSLLKWFAFLGLVLPVIVYSQNHPPSVTNVRFNQKTDGTFMVDVYYTLADADNDSLTVAMQVSDDNGSNWNYGCTSLTGDVGPKIVSGNKHIVWDFFADHPQVSGDNYKVKIVAEEKPAMILEWVSVPAGNFAYGENGEARSIDYEYSIMKYPVTNRQYLQFLNSAKSAGFVTINSKNVIAKYTGDAMYPAGSYILYQLDESLEGYTIGFINYNGSQFVLSPNDTYLDHPVVTVSWFGAWAFCKFYGLRLPSEEEWEKAARGTGGSKFPWGGEATFGRHANYYNSGDPFDNATTPVGFYDGQTHNGFQTYNSPSPYGAYDMAGNVFQWTNSFYGQESPDNRERVFRGGAWTMSSLETLQTFYRLSYNPENRGYGLGFRCVKDK